MTDITEYLLESDVKFYGEYALPAIRNRPEKYDLEGFESVLKIERKERYFEQFQKDKGAQYEMNAKYGRYVWDISDQWYQKWCVVFSIEHMCNWVIKDSETTIKMSNVMNWLRHIGEKYRIHSDHLVLLKDMFSYITDWHQSNRALTLKGVFKLNSIPFFPPAWFTNKSRQGNEGLAPSYLATFVPPFRLQDSQVPERWDQVFLKGVTVQQDQKLNLVPILINTNITILGLTVHCDDYSSRLMFVMPKAKYGNLESRLESEIPRDYLKPCQLALNITKDIKNLHWNFIHGNIHPRNILFTHADYIGELVDITFMKQNNDKSLFTGGRWPYVPNEVALSGQSTSADIYALGIVLWQLISRVTFPADSLVDPHIYRIEPIPDALEEWQSICLDCMHPDPEKRPNAYSLYKRLNDLCTRLKTENVLISQVTLNYITQRRTERDLFLASSHTLCKVGDRMLTASVTRYFNQQLNHYPCLFPS